MCLIKGRNKFVTCKVNKDLFFGTMLSILDTRKISLIDLKKLVINSGIKAS